MEFRVVPAVNRKAVYVRRAVDITHIPCGKDGWGHRAALVDCRDRSCIGYEFALRGRAKEAERALEEACLNRFGTLRSAQYKPVIRRPPS